MAFGKKGESRSRHLNGEIKVLERKGEYLFSTEIWLLNDKVTRNKWQFVDVEKNAKQFLGTPVLIAYIDNGKTIGDGHNFRPSIDPKTGEEAASFTDATAERIVGQISDDPNDIRIEKVEGKTWIVAKAILWRWYAKELVDKIERNAQQGRAMSVSIEALVSKNHMEGDTEVEDEYLILGTTILGDHVSPAVDGAHIAMLQDLTQFKELKIKAASYNGGNAEHKPKNDKISKGVSKHMEYFNRNQLRELASRFEGYTVLSAGKDESGVHVGLRDKDGFICECTISEISKTVMPEEIKRVNVNASFPCGLEIDACDLVEQVVCETRAQNKVLSEQNEKLTADLEKANASVKTMQEAETARRKEAAKTAATAMLSAINANRTDAAKFSDDLISVVLNSAENGEYNEVYGADHAWTGDKAAESAVRDLAMKQQMEMDKARAASEKKTYAFEQGYNGANGVDANSVEAIYARFTK